MRIRPRILIAAIAAAFLLVAGPPAAPAPNDDVVHYDGEVRQTVHIPTRTGYRVTIDLAFPAIDGERATGQFPVVACLCYISTVNNGGDVLVGLPDDPTELLDHSVFAREGYVAASVRVGGSGTSEYGPWDLSDETWQLMNYDAIEWLGTQPWSTGKVGTWGISGNGMSQIFTSQLRPPHLTTMIPGVSGHDSWDSLMPGGMPSLQIAAFACGIPGAATTALNGLPVPLGNSDTIPELAPDELQYLVEMNTNKVLRGQVIPYCPPLEGAWSHSTRDEFWTGPLRSDVENITIPVWAWGGWDDIFDLAIPKLYDEVGSAQRMLTMGLNSHFSPGGGDGFDKTAEAIRWFDHWLKGIDNGIAEEVESAGFRYYLDRGFVWKSAPEYPIPGTDYTPFHLGAGPSIALAEGSLSTTLPTTEGDDTYLYNPLAGGLTEMSYDLVNPLVPNNAASDTIVHHNASTGDQRLVSVGPDTVTYVSEPLTEDVEITGPVTAKIFATTTATDTDFLFDVIDVFPDELSTSGPQPGYWNLVTSGNLKGTFRTYADQYRTQTPIPPGEVVEYDVEGKPVSYLFEKGHRIAVTISSGDFPRLMPNLNPASVTIHHSKSHPTQVVLPVIGEKANARVYRAAESRGGASPPPSPDSRPTSAAPAEAGAAKAVSAGSTPEPEREGSESVDAASQSLGIGAHTRASTDRAAIPVTIALLLLTMVASTLVSIRRRSHRSSR